MLSLHGLIETTFSMDHAKIKKAILLDC